MKNLNEKEFSTKLIELPDNQPPKSRIYVNEAPTNSVVLGALLEACIRVDTFYLLFMTDDIPNEDMLHIHLLDKKLNLVDSATIGSAYATGSFSKLEMHDPDTVTFHFIGSTQWLVQVLPKRKMLIPLLSDPKGVSRKFCFKSHLKIGGRPLPDSK